MNDNKESYAKALDATVLLTSKVKLAVMANELLNHKDNDIHVNSTQDQVELKGHVTSTDLRGLAAEITRTVLAENNASQVVENDLKVRH